MKMIQFTGSLVLCLILTAAAFGGSVGIGISGEGAVNDSTIQVGKPVSIDIYIKNDTTFTGFSFGFKLVSDKIKEVVHIADSGKGLNERGDVKGHNGWDDKSVWDFGIFAVESDWDGKMPELLGFGGLCIKQKYSSHPRKKVLSFDVMFNEAGTVVVDTAFFPPGGRWLLSSPPPGPSEEPKWLGPFKFNVVK